MTPKEKAEKLIEKYQKLDIEIGGQYDGYTYLKLFDAKECALIAVDEVLNVLPQSEYLEDRDEYRENIERLYWKDVKQEIEKL